MIYGVCCLCVGVINVCLCGLCLFVLFRCCIVAYWCCVWFVFAVVVLCLC